MDGLLQLLSLQLLGSRTQTGPKAQAPPWLAHSSLLGAGATPDHRPAPAAQSTERAGITTEGPYAVLPQEMEIRSTENLKKKMQRAEGELSPTLVPES